MVDDQTRTSYPAGAAGAGATPAQRAGAAATGEQAADPYLPALALALMGGVLLLASVLVLVAVLTGTDGGPDSATSGAVLVAGTAVVAAVALALTVLNAVRVRDAGRSVVAGRAGLPLLAASLLVPLLTAVVAAVVGGLEWPGSAALLALVLPCGGLALVALATWSTNRRPTRLFDQPGSARRVAGVLATISAMPLGLVLIVLLGATTGEQEPAVTWGAVGAGVIVSLLVVVNLVRVIAPGASLTALVRLLVVAVVLAPVVLVVARLTGGPSVQGWTLVLSASLCAVWVWPVFCVMATLETSRPVAPAGQRA